MPKGRMLNRRISKDEVVAKLSIYSSLLYTWCIPHLDVEGRIEATPEILKGVVVPYRKDFTLKKIEECVKELTETPLIIHYGDNHKYMQFNGFEKNQTLNKDREAPSEIPAPAKLLRNSCETPAKVKLSLSKDNIKISTNIMQYTDFEKSVTMLWNNFVSKKPILSKIEKVSNERRIHLKKRYISKHYQDNIGQAIEAIAKYPFLLGENKSGWKISFDWIIANDNNYLKILEGKYGSNSNSQDEFKKQWQKPKE